MTTSNLSSKNIKDFTAEDTIYMRIKPREHNGNLFLCQFISYDPKKWTVTGKVISSDTNERIYAHRISKGWTESVSLKDCCLYGKSPEEEREYRGFYHWFNSLGYALDPMEEYKVISNNIHVSKHPSFGVIRFTNSASSNESPMFGSSINHRNVINITICTATHDRDLNNDWIHEKEQLIEVSITANQFAQMLSSFNRGEGTPCTIRHINGKRMPPPPYISKMDLFKQEFEATMHNMGVDLESGLRNAVDILKNKSSLTKGDRELILNAIEKNSNAIKSTIPFIDSQFKEQMQEVVTEAKSEVEAYISNTINTLGLQALQEGVSSFRLPSNSITEKKEESTDDNTEERERSETV